MCSRHCCSPSSWGSSPCPDGRTSQIPLGSSLLPVARGKALGFDPKQLVPDSAGVSCTRRQISWSNLRAGGNINIGCWGGFFCSFSPLSCIFFFTS